MLSLYGLKNLSMCNLTGCSITLRWRNHQNVVCYFFAFHENLSCFIFSCRMKELCNRLYFERRSLTPFLAHLSRRLCRWAYSIVRHPSSVVGVVRPSTFQTPSPSKPRSRFLPNFSYSIYRPGKRIMAFYCKSRWDKYSGCYGNLQLPLTYNGEP